MHKWVGGMYYDSPSIIFLTQFRNFPLGNPSVFQKSSGVEQIFTKEGEGSGFTNFH